MVLSLNDVGFDPEKAGKLAFEGVPDIKKEEIDGKRIVLYDFEFRRNGKGEEFAIMLIEYNGEQRKLLMGSDIILKTLRYWEDDESTKKQIKEEGLSMVLQKVASKRNLGTRYWKISN